MNIIRRAMFHRNLLTNTEDASPGSPLSAPLISQLSTDVAHGTEVENYLVYTATFNLSGSAPTWAVSSAVYTTNLLSDGSLFPGGFTTFNKGQVSTGTGTTTDPVHARVDINCTVDPNITFIVYPHMFGILMHLKTGTQVYLTSVTRASASIIRFAGLSCFDSTKLSSGDSMILKIYLNGDPR